MSEQSARLLSKRKLLEGLGDGLRSLGYAPVPGPSGGCAALFYKCVDDLVLTLGVELSTRYKDRFTASLYLAPSFEWAYMPSDFPRNAYQRVGLTLLPEERARLLDPLFAQEGVVDSWWIGFNELAIASFVGAVQLAEPRFLSQPALRDEIRRSEKMKKHVTMVARVLEIAERMVRCPDGLRYQPPRAHVAVPRKYYCAAEVVLSEMASEKITPAYVELIANDAWRKATLCCG